MSDVAYEVSETVVAALMVLNGKYGIDAERVRRLQEDGLDPDTVQNCVNDLVGVFERYG